MAFSPRGCLMKCLVTRIFKGSQGTCSTHMSCQQYSTLGLGSTTKKKKREPHFYELIRPWKTEEEFIDTIMKSVLHEDDHIIAINKPNGVAMAGSMYENLPTRVQVIDRPDHTIKSIIEQLKERWEIDDLKMIYCQPRLYSGPVVFAKSENSFQIMKKYFRHVRANKVLCQKYLLLSVGVPEGMADPVDFPMKILRFGEHNLTIKCQKPSKNARKRGYISQASVKHNVLSQSTHGSGGQVKTAAVEFSTNFCKWDAVEAYMVDHCLCPVLGDHTYSSRITSLQGKTMRLSPKQCPPDTQKLPYELTKALEFETDRLLHHIPLHVHCSQLTLPNLKMTKRQNNHNMLKITAPIPEFFQRSLELLNLEFTDDFSPKIVLNSEPDLHELE